MARIDRYLLSQLMTVFGLASLVLVMVYWINRAVVLFDQLIADGQSAWVFLELTALALPSIIKLVLPLAAFAATLYALARLSGDSELTVVQATGASPWRLARPVLVFGLIVGVLIGVLSHVLTPASLGRLNARQSEIAATATARLLREGEFISPRDGLTLYIRQITPQGELRGLLLSDTRDPGQSVTYTAASAYLVRGTEGPQLVMVDGMIQRLDEDRGRLLSTGFTDLSYDLSPLLPSATQARRNSRELSTLELLRPSEALTLETGKTGPQLFAEAQDRIAEGLLAPVAALIGLGSLLLGQFSRFGVWRQVVLAVVLVIVIKGIESASLQAVRDEPTLWPLSYLPAVLGFTAAAALLWLAARPRCVARAVPA
ncbi:LPS export ABC transporter permease LptF [Rubellimicrobium rubrum]|uniref:LPS export ABC transporter permease LptF n=1 Tax=Rubellimicrobium rubrum TaxID=2585369 RepID=A0A5C4N919_9RHOB|nr:LPS export ABC transporter permease LptF [Rubellimicrobium rubrum]TNC52762.1 LPS export ABC transporter permease LptF [Rubellimicrobium rubrum]